MTTLPSALPPNKIAREDPPPLILLDDEMIPICNPPYEKNMSPKGSGIYHIIILHEKYWEITFFLELHGNIR